MFRNHCSNGNTNSKAFYVMGKEQEVQESSLARNSCHRFRHIKTRLESFKVFVTIGQRRHNSGVYTGIESKWQNVIRNQYKVLKRVIKHILYKKEKTEHINKSVNLEPAKKNFDCHILVTLCTGTKVNKIYLKKVHT